MNFLKLEINGLKKNYTFQQNGHVWIAPHGRKTPPVHAQEEQLHFLPFDSNMPACQSQLWCRLSCTERSPGLPWTRIHISDTGVSKTTNMALDMRTLLNLLAFHLKIKRSNNDEFCSKNGVGVDRSNSTSKLQKTLGSEKNKIKVIISDNCGLHIQHQACGGQ